MEVLTEMLARAPLEIREFFGIDWTSVEFDRWEIALGLAAILVVVWAVRLLRKKKSFRYQSGLKVFEGGAGGLVVGAFKFLSRAGFVLTVSLVLLALADPFVTNTEEKKTIMKREVIFLLDASGSMADPLSNTEYRSEEGYYESGEDIAKAILGREGVLRFLDQREGKNERYSLWIFSSNVYHLQRWTDDFYEFEYKVYSAPHVILGRKQFTKGQDNPNLRLWRLAGARGSTNITKALKAIIRDIEKGGREDVKRRALIIVSDVDFDFHHGEEAGAELRRLSDLGVVPYVVITSAKDKFTGSAEEFLSAVRSLGGRAYLAQNEENVKNIFDEINELEVVEEVTEVKRSRVRLYPKPLFLALVLSLISALFGVVADGLEIP